NGNIIRGNSFFNNFNLGIDLNADGGTSNDSGDGDSGPNNLQNFPDSPLAWLAFGTAHIQYSVSSSTANSAYPLTIDFYSTGADVREGKTLVYTDTYLSSEATLPKVVNLGPG